ncbi:hypothetical protein ACQ4LE_007344 [Meloidogyne hapla]|uniref:FUN14 domain-containing protein 1 n=1 Tax=Meloidogyne hapla TaxID=6305 RepID=A0A1I8BQP0_MELHA
MKTHNISGNSQFRDPKKNEESSDDDRCLIPFLKDVLTVANVSDQPPVVQIAIGASGGVVTGFLFGKTSKFVAAFVGGAILIVQLFECQGYLKINKKRLSRDIGQAKEHISAMVDAFGNANVNNKNWVDDCVAKGEALISRKSSNGMVSKFLIKNIRAFGGFLGGALLGFGLS